MKSVHEMEREERCQCGAVATRAFVPSRLHLSKTRVRHAEYNPAFGKVIKNERHLANEMSKHEERTGSRMVEVGNDYGSGDKMVTTARKRKAEDREASWRDLKVDLP